MIVSASQTKGIQMQHVPYWTAANGENYTKAIAERQESRPSCGLLKRPFDMKGRLS